MATSEQIKAASSASSASATAKQSIINLSIDLIAFVVGTVLLYYGTNWQTGVGLALLLIYNKSRT